MEIETSNTTAEIVTDELRADADKESWLLLKELVVILSLVFMIYLREFFFNV